VPVSFTFWGLHASPSRMFRTAVFVPVAVGVNVTLTMQLLPGGKSVPQVFLEIANSAALLPVIEAPVIGMSISTVERLLLVRVAVCGLLVVPIGSLPKLRLGGKKVTIVAQAARLATVGLKKPSVDGRMVTAPLTGPKMFDGMKATPKLHVPPAGTGLAQPLLLKL